MKNSLLYYLIVSSLILTGCEVDQQSSNTVTERPFGTIFDTPETTTVELTTSKVQEGDKTNLSTSFSPQENISDAKQVATRPGADLDKNDLLYGFYNSGIVGKPADFDNFFDEAEYQDPGTIITTSTNTTNTNTASAFGTLFDSPDSDSVNFGDLFSSDFGDSDFDFQLDQERQEKINKIKEDTIATQKESIIADQIRNKDIDEQLTLDLANLEKALPISEKELAKKMKDELRHKTRLLNAEAALKVAELKMLASTRSDNIVSRIENRALSATSAARKELIKNMLSVEPENYYQLKQQEKQLEAAYQVDIAKVKLQYQKKMDIVEQDVKLLREANRKIINNRAAELEAQRIAEALVVETRIKAKNQEIVNQSYPEFKDKILEYSNAFKAKLAQKEELVLFRLEEKYTSAKLARKSARELENRQYIAKINQQIKQEQDSYKEKSSGKLHSVRDAKIDSIAKNLKKSIKNAESDGVKALANLKAQNARKFQKQKSVLQAPYKKKIQTLNQKSQQKKSKILSKFNSENYAIVAKEKKEIGVINRKIDARVDADIKAALESFKVVKKDDAPNKTTSDIESDKESGFFSSWF